MRDIEIRVTGNGYTMRVRDPELDEKNRKSEGYVDPYIEMVFTKESELLAGVKKALAGMKPAQSEYETAFAKAIAEGSSDG